MTSPKIFCWKLNFPERPVFTLCKYYEWKYLLTSRDYCKKKLVISTDLTNPESARDSLRYYWYWYNQNQSSKKETLAQMFSCEFCKISRNIFFKEPFGRLLHHKPSKHSPWCLHLQNTSSRRVQDVLIKTNIVTLLIRLQKTSSRRLQDVLIKTIIYSSWPYVFKTSSRRL